MSFEIEGLEELERLIKELGKLPQKCVTQAAKDGAKIAQASAKVLAPKDIGNLRKGIIIKGEKKPPRIAKKVCDIMMNPQMNDIFVKEANGKRYYYPASMEFGFITKSGAKTKGYHFLRDSLENNKEQIEKAVLEKLIQGIEKEMGR